MTLPYPVQPPHPGGWIGDIGYTPTHVHVPAGAFPIRGTTWSVLDMSRQVEKISTTGIVLAVVFVWFCFLGLLFLLMKEVRTEGYIQVTVSGPGFTHTTLVPATGPHSAVQAMQAVNYARSVAG